MNREQIESYALRVSAECEELAAKLSWYEEQYRLSKAQHFGPSSEQTLPEQISLFNEAETESYGQILPEPTLEKVKKPKQKGHKDQITEALPTEEIEYCLTSEEMVCPKCGASLQEMKTEIHKELTVIPAQIRVTEHIRHLYVCRSCDREGTTGTIIPAPMPKAPFVNSLASPSLLSYIMTRKYVEAIPLYRQEQQFARSGLALSRQTLSNWMVRASESHLKRLYDLMHEELVEREILHADETVLEVLREPGREASAQSYMWLYRTSGDSVPIVLYEYTQGRSGDYPKEFLKGFKGYLHTDGYGGYHKLTNPKSETPADIILVGCWAHARRKYTDALKAISPKEQLTATNIQQGLSYCNTLFHVERECKASSPKERFTCRQEKAAPVLSSYFAWVSSMEQQVLPKSKLGEAITYSINQKKYLERYLLDGRLEISNNRAERSIKPFVIGRKNWLFSNTPKGAEASAIIYSIVETAKENGLDPFSYLQYLFEQLPNISTNDYAALTGLLPWSENLPDTCRSLGNVDRK